MNLLYIFGSNKETIECELQTRQIAVSGDRVTDIFRLINWLKEKDLFQPTDYAIISNEAFKPLILKNETLGMSVAFMYAIRELGSIEPIEMPSHKEMSENGKVVDTLSMDEFPEEAVVIRDRHYFTSSSVAITEHTKTRDPFTNLPLLSAELDRIRSDTYLSAMGSMRQEDIYRLAKRRELSGRPVVKRLFTQHREIYCQYCGETKKIEIPKRSLSDGGGFIERDILKLSRDSFKTPEKQQVIREEYDIPDRPVRIRYNTPVRDRPVQDHSFLTPDRILSLNEILRRGPPPVERK